MFVDALEQNKTGLNQELFRFSGKNIYFRISL
jgi:hypothetical protein